MCSRIVYKGLNNILVTGRTMDWGEDMNTEMWLFPRGMQRDGETGTNSISWISKYGSVIVSVYNAATSEGMNEKGLVANLLWLSESVYPESDKSKAALSVSLWAQYVLDNFSTVAEAVNSLSEEKFVILPCALPSLNIVGTVHLSISDPSGDNAIFEYINGKLTIHHGKTYVVMTNSPTYDKQLALTDYWDQVGGENMLPGTSKATDRFVRGSYYLNIIPKLTDDKIAIASVFSVIRNLSMPLGHQPETGESNICFTIWRTVFDQKNKIYFYESVFSPNIFWVELNDLNFSEGNQVKKLPMSQGELYSGNAASLFQETEPFGFLRVTV